MGQDPNQPYPGQYGQPSGIPPQPPQPPQYPGGYQQQGGYPPPAPGYQQPNSGYQQPNSGYQQEQQSNYQYQQPYGQPGQVFNTGHPHGPSSMNMEPNTAAGLSYLAGWITGLIFFLVEKQNRFVRFNAMQSILLSAAAVVASIVLTIVLTIVAFIPVIGLLGLLLWPLFYLAAFGVWIYLLINAFQGKYIKLPIIGNYAERFANPGAPTVM